MIHPTAIIDPGARIADNVEIGPYCFIGADVVIGEGCIISPHVVIKGHTEIGSHNRIFQFASIGEDCQDKKYHGEPTRLVIGDHNVFREGVTVHRGTVQDKSLTQIGSHNLFMAYAHVAHDCVIGNHCIMANQATLGGHVTIGDYAILGGLAAVHQFCHVGAHAMCGGGSIITKDIAAFVMVSGNPAHVHGINVEGLRRRGFSAESIAALREAYKQIFRGRQPMSESLPKLQAQAEDDAVKVFIESLLVSTRGITR